MNLGDKYTFLRTYLEDMIEAHQENAAAWKVIKEYYESRYLCVPTVELPKLIEELIKQIPTQ